MYRYELTLSVNILHACLHILIEMVVILKTYAHSESHMHV